MVRIEIPQWLLTIVGFKVEKLTGDNYHHWKFQMKICFIGKDLLEIVTGAETLQVQPSAKAQRKFKNRENLALATICLSVATNLQIYVRSAQNAKEARESLEKHFEEKSLSRKMFYRRKLYAAHTERGTKVIDHINCVKILSEIFRGSGRCCGRNGLGYYPDQ